jgi:hypothetical protein
MRRIATATVLLLVAAAALVALPAAGQIGPDGLKHCQGVAFSTEEDFVTHGPEPADGNPIISDGDLLGPGCVVCARNADLLKNFDVNEDLGLDAADILSIDRYLVAFSTELDSPHGNFGAGDLLITNGAVIPNSALLAAFKLARLDLGLDAVHFVGDIDQILRFVDYARTMRRDDWAREGSLQGALRQYRIDIWFSTEGTAPIPPKPAFLDGDLLSARDGTIVASNAVLLPASVPAGIPQRGVDFGLDAVSGGRDGKREGLQFSTEILFEGEPAFTDGDVLKIGNGVVWTNAALVRCFEPKADFLGLDALSVAREGITLQPQITHFNQVAVDDISGLGLAYTLEQPFGQWIQIHGHIPSDVDEFRVVYCSAASWPCSATDIDGIEVMPTQNWHVSCADGMGGCTSDCHWYSNSEGWFDASTYRSLRDCTPDLPLTMWYSPGAPNPEGLYVVWLEFRRGAVVDRELFDHYVQLDNAPPQDLALEPKFGNPCGEFGPFDMPMMVQGHFYDAHFWRYKLVLYGGDPLGVKDYGYIAHGDNPFDNVGPTGTGPGLVDLHAVNLNDLPTASIDDCAYSVTIHAWDRTIRGYKFDAPNDDRPIWTDGWYAWYAFTFDYTP